MRYLVPSYYFRFRCIADKCRHSCCIGWDVAVDSDTVSTLSESSALSARELCTHFYRDGDTCYVGMCDGGRCPMLDGGGLCRLITECGEGALPLICKRHPRFILLLGDRVAVGLGIACEEACRTVLLHKEPFELVEYADLPREWGDIPYSGDGVPYGTEYLSAAISKIESAKTLADANVALRAHFGVPDISRTADGWIDLISECEMLDPSWQKTLAGSAAGGRKDFAERELILKNLLKYFVFRYLPEAEDVRDLGVTLNLAIVLADVADRLFDKNGIADAAGALDVCRALSSEIEYSEENMCDIRFEIEMA